MAWYIHLLIAIALPFIGIAFAGIWSKLVVDDWWTPIIVLVCTIVGAIFYLLFIIGAAIGKHIVIV